MASLVKILCLFTDLLETADGMVAGTIPSVGPRKTHISAIVNVIYSVVINVIVIV